MTLTIKLPADVKQRLDVIIDTGPPVAYFDRDSEFHRWTCDRFRELTDPLISCEPVLTEAMFVLKRGGLDPDLVLTLVERGELICDFDVSTEVAPRRRMLKKYHDLPATRADACLVRMSELHAAGVVLTLDRDFRAYRRNGRQTIPVISPD